VKPKILVVDDDVLLCKMMAETLNEYGYTTIRAYNGEKALELFRQESPDMILLDVAMPGLSGYEVAAQIRTEERSGHRTVIVITTAYSQVYFASAEVQEQIDGFLTKPYLVEDVIRTIRNRFGES
jgi:CheY-like chemotaxis protein